MSYFKNPLDPDDIQIKSKIKEWMKLYFDVESENIISIEEVPCWEPKCPDIHTKIIFYKTNLSQEFIIYKPLTFVRKIDFASRKNMF